MLWKVKMPLAFLEILLNNQTLMFALFMVMIELYWYS